MRLKTTAGNLNSDDDEHQADTEDEDETRSDQKKKHTAGKKRAAEVVQESPVAVAKRKKTDASDSSPVKARVTGDKPKTTKQLFDAINRKKLKACRQTMEVLQHMSLPLKRSDEYVPPDDSDDESQSVVDQQGWSWMIHCLSCYTQVKPNDDGGKNKKKFLSMPEYHMWAGSEAAAEHLRLSFAPVKAFKIIVHTSFDDYFEAFRSESAKTKEAPPRPERDPKANKKKRPYAKKWKKSPTTK